VIAVNLLLIEGHQDLNMGNCSSAKGLEKAPTSVNKRSRRTVPTVPQAQEKMFSRRSFVSSSPNALVFQDKEVCLEECLKASATLLVSRQDESKLNEQEVAAALKVSRALTGWRDPATRR
jgi:hypothetical protein